MIYRSVELSPHKHNKMDKIWNLSELLGQNVPTPQKMINERLFPQKQRRSMKKVDLGARMQTFARPLTKCNTRINFQHYRIKSSLKNRSQNGTGNKNFVLQRNNSQTVLKEQFRDFVIPLKFCKSLPISAVSLQKSYSSQQLLSRRTSIKKHSQLHFTQRMLNPQPQYMDTFIGKSLEIRKKNQPFLQQCNQQQHVNFQCLNPNIKDPQNRKKKFLRKGSSLQKQIVVNLLKNKMIKQQQFDLQKQYTMNDILKMVRLYKGIPEDKITNTENMYASQKLESRSPSRSNQSQKKNMICPINVVQQFHKSIQGWQIQQEFETQFIKKEQTNLIIPEKNSIAQPNQNL